MRQPPERARRLQGDGGALIVELALISPFLFTLALGIFEFGFAYREKANLTNAVRSAQRADTGNGASRSADYNAILAFSSSMAQAKNFKVNYLVIYKTDSTGAPSTPTCLTTGVSATNCNYYTAAQIANIVAAGSESAAGMGNATDTTCTAGAPDLSYCPATRTDSQDAAAGPDWVGIYVNGTYTAYTGLLPGQVTFTESSLGRLDPQPGP